MVEGRGVLSSNSPCCPLYLFATPCLRLSFTGLIVHLSSWNATRHQPWGKNFPYLLLYSSVHRHFWTHCRSCAGQHIHCRGLEIRQYPTFALDQVKLWSKLKCHRAILFDGLIIWPHSPLGVLIASARSQSVTYHRLQCWSKKTISLFLLFSIINTDLVH